MAQSKWSASPSFSPDGARLAYISDAGGLPEVYVVSTVGGAPTKITSFQDPVGGVRWSPTEDRLAIVVSPGGGMNSQIYLARSDGKDLVRITDGEKDNNWLNTWTRDGKELMFASNRRDPAAMDAYLYDVAAKQARLVAKNPGIGYLTGATHDRRRALLYRMESRGNDNLFLVDDKGEQILTAHEGPGSFFGELAPDDKTIYVGSNKDSDLVAFGKIAIDGAPKPIETIIARDDGELAIVAISSRATAALVWNIAGRNELQLVELATGKILPSPAPPDELVHELVWSPDGNQLAVTLSGATTPVNIFILANGAWRQITQSPHDGVALAELVRPELVKLSAHDDLQLSGWLYRPRNATKPGPIVLSFHGGPEGQELPGLQSQYQALVARGIAVFAPNVRGSSGFGKKFVNLDNGALRVDAVKDIKACVDYLVGANVADPKRIGIMGGSYGGYMTMAGVTEYPTMFAAAANLFGIVSFATFFESTEPWMAAISKIEFGDPQTQAELLKQLSPLNKVERIATPVIVLHGKNDTNVPLIEAEQIVASLRKRKVPVEYVLFPDGGHGWQKTENKIKSTVAIVRWFETHLR